MSYLTPMFILTPSLTIIKHKSTVFPKRNYSKKDKTPGDTSGVFALFAVHLTYARVGTGETYFAALAALNLLVNLETFLEAACLEIVPLAAACINFFSARASFSLANSKLPSAIAASKFFKTALRWFLILSSVSCSLLVDNSDSFLCGFNVCHNFFTPLFFKFLL